MMDLTDTGQTPSKPKGTPAKRGKTDQGIRSAQVAQYKTKMEYAMLNNASQSVDRFPKIPRVGRLSAPIQPGNYQVHDIGPRAIRATVIQPSSKVLNRAQTSKEIAALASEHLALLNTILLRLRGFCPSCFILIRKYVPRHKFDNCPVQLKARILPHRAFKSFFIWDKFDVCRSCGCCQEKGKNNRITRAHELAGYPDGGCEWDGLLYRVLWIFWSVPQYRDPMLVHCQLLPATTQAEFQGYLRSLKTLAGLPNLQRTFIWCCYTVDPLIFSTVIANQRPSGRSMALLADDVARVKESNGGSSDVFQ